MILPVSGDRNHLSLPHRGWVPSGVPDALIRPLAIVAACMAALVAVTVVHALLVTLDRRLPVIADLTGR
jgi:hypothetical protein